MRKVLGNPWFTRVFTAAAVALLVVGMVRYVQSRPDPSPATNTQTYGRDYELPAETTQYTAADLPKGVRRVAGEFILAAVGREDMKKAWKLTHPDFRKDCACSYKEWLTGNIPVQPYPTDSLDQAAFEIDEVTKNEVWMRVLLTPKKGADIKPQVFDIGIKAHGAGAKKAWLVNYWAAKVSIPVPATIDGS